MRLYNNPDKQERECSRCRQVKPYSEFKNRSDYPHIKRSICKKCNIKIEADRLQMKSWTNKIHAIRFVTNDVNNCQICNNVGIENLPMFDFHHPYPELSSETAKQIGFWKSVRYKPWSIIRNELINQKVIVICRNCHMIIEAHLFNKYKQVILENWNISSFHSIEMLNWNQRKSAKNHILKKIIILDLWDGKCTNCGFGISIANIDNLPALEIHHEYSELKVNMFSNFIKSTNAYREIIDMIFEEKCTCLCRNCHVMVQSTFFNEKEVDIFKKYKSKFC